MPKMKGIAQKLQMDVFWYFVRRIRPSRMRKGRLQQPRMIGFVLHGVLDVLSRKS